MTKRKMKTRVGQSSQKEMEKSRESREKRRADHLAWRGGENYDEVQMELNAMGKKL